MKIIGCILIIVGFSVIGYLLVDHLRLRIRELCDVRRQIIFLRGEIRCGYRALPEVFEELEHRTSGCWSAFYGEIARESKEHTEGTLEQLWRNAMLEKLQKSCLNEKEKQDWLEFGVCIGKMDSKGQIAFADLCEERFCQYIQTEQEQFQTQAKLYQTLSVLGGVFLSVLLI